MAPKPSDHSALTNWSIFIDIEGFSKIYQTSEAGKGRALELLKELSFCLYKIGKTIYPNHGQELFIYQVGGDSFIITPPGYYTEPDLERPLAISVALLRAIILKGGTARAAVSLGSISDILACHYREIGDNLQSGCISIGNGLMTIIQVMGDALINAYKLSSLKPGGPMLLLENTSRPLFDSSTFKILEKYETHIEIDWIRSNSSLSDDILKKIGVVPPSSSEIVGFLQNYVNANANLSSEWQANAMRLINWKS